MSAICGVVNLNGRPVTPESIDSMLAAMDYWGPDGSGVWYEGIVGMGHLLLHSTPESVGDTLPRSSVSGGLVLTSHARIDNREELLRYLNVPHAMRREMPDSSLILLAYEKWGYACPEYLIGDWCFGIWDKSRQSLFLARDHHGNTGLYYYRNANFVAFSSCIKGLLALAAIPREPNPLAIAQTLVSWPDHGEPTCYKDIMRLPPAHQMLVTPEAVTKRQYWHLEKTTSLRLGSDQEYLDAFMELYTEAVRCRMRSLRPVAATLSGGLDSGSVSVIAARELGCNGKRLQTFSSVPLYNVTDDMIPAVRFGDERPFIEATARYAGNIDTALIQSSDVTPVQGIEWALKLNDGPGHAAANQFWIVSLLKSAQAHGVGTLLTGQGGNASISWHAPGYLACLAKNGDWSAIRHELAALQPLTNRPLWRLLAGRLIKPLCFDPLLEKLRRLWRAPEPWLHYSAINRKLSRKLRITERMLSNGHDPWFRPLHDQREARLRLIRPGRSAIGFIWQENGAGFGIDVRDPTYDKRLLEFCLSIPDDQYHRDGKDRYLIRRAMTGLMPNTVLDNNRRGLQAADIVKRTQANFDETEAALRRIERSALAGEYLDLPLMRRTLERSLLNQSKEVARSLETIFFRGLMAGLFLLRFETSAAPLA